MIEATFKRLIDRLKKSKIERHHLIYAFAMVFLLLASSISVANLSPYRAHEGSSQYFRAKVLSESAASSQDTGSGLNVIVNLLDGSQKNQTTQVTWNNNFGDAAARNLPLNSEVLLYKDSANGNQYSLVARWYMPGIATLFIILLVLVVTIGAWRGITSVFGLVISIAILALFVIPSIVDGHNAFVTCIEGAVLITIVSLYIAHGFTKRTTVAFVASLFTLLLIVGLTAFASYTTGTSEIISRGYHNTL